MPNKKKRKGGKAASQGTVNRDKVMMQYRQELDQLLQQQAALDEKGLNSFLNKHEIALVQGYYKEKFEQCREAHFFPHIHCITSSNYNPFMTVFQHYSEQGYLNSNEAIEGLDQVVNMGVNRSGNTFLMELLLNEQWNAVKQWLDACQKYQVGLDLKKCDDEKRTVLELAMMMDTVPTEILENLINLYPGIGDISSRLLEEAQWDICGSTGECVNEEMADDLAKSMEMAHRQNNQWFIGFMEQNYPGIYRAHRADMEARSVSQNTVREYSGVLRSVGIDPERDENARCNEIRLMSQGQRNIGLLQASGRKMGSCTMIELLIGINGGPIKVQFSANGVQIDVADQAGSDTELITLNWTANNTKAVIDMLRKQGFLREYRNVVDEVRKSLEAEQGKLTGSSKRKKYIENSVAAARSASVREDVDLPVRAISQRIEPEGLSMGLSRPLGFFSEGKAASENVGGKDDAFQGHDQTGSEDLEDWLVVEPPC